MRMPTGLRRPGNLRFLGLAGGVGAVLALWFALAPHLIYGTNQNRMSGDQQAAMDLARSCRVDPWPMRTNAVSNSLFAWTAAKTVWHDEEHTFFVRGKWLNVVVCAVALSAAAMGIATGWGVAHALVFLLLAGFGALLPRAVFFQPEPFYFLLFAASAAAGFSLLNRNSLWLYAVFGLCAGLAHLAKPGILPLVALWFGAGIFRLAMHLWPRCWWPSPARSDAWHPWRHVAGCALALTVGGAVVAPLGVWSAQHLGKPFFNMTPYWMWQEDYGRESVPLLVNHGTAHSMEQLPPAERPSAARYFSTHTPAQAHARLTDGVWGKMSRFIAPSETSRRKGAPHRRILADRGWLLVAVMTLAVVGGAVARFAFPPDGTKRGIRIWRPEAAQTLFAAGTVALYTVALGWYEPIGRGDRFMMVLYVPLLLWGLHAIHCAGRRREVPPWFRALLAGALALLVLAAALRMVPVAMRPEFVADQPL